MKLIFCAGNNKKNAEIAIKHGWLYGIRHDHKPYYYPHFIDINWKNYDWNNYLSVVEQHKPEMAMVPDYEIRDRSALESMCNWVREAGARDVLVCPKFHGAINDIPKWCTVAISVPSSYAGFLPRPNNLINRKIHLLGGTPQNQVKLYRIYSSHGGRVISADCNAMLKASHRGTYFEGGKWRNEGKRLDIYDAFELSIKNIMSYWNSVLINEQPKLI